MGSFGEELVIRSAMRTARRLVEAYRQDRVEGMDVEAARFVEKRPGRPTYRMRALMVCLAMIAQRAAVRRQGHVEQGVAWSVDVDGLPDYMQFASRFLAALMNDDHVEANRLYTGLYDPAGSGPWAAVGALVHLASQAQVEADMAEDLRASEVDVLERMWNA